MFNKIEFQRLLSIAIFIAVGSLTQLKTTAQTQPIQGLPQQIPDRFPQPIPLPAPLPNQQPNLQPPQNPPPSIEPSTVQIPVRKIEIVGSTLLKPIDLQRITRPIEGRSVTLRELQRVADAITQLYLDRGYITSRAIVAKQDIVDGVVKIQAIEGSIEKIDIQGLERLQAGYVRDRLQQGIQTPFNQNTLEEQLRLLKTDPLLGTLEASLRPGTGSGQSILTVRLKEANSLRGFVGSDSYSSPSLGAERIGAVLSYQNLTGIGDEISASYFRSFQGGSNAFDFNYRLPVNGMNGTVQVRYAPNRSKIVNSGVTPGEIRSDTDLYEISYRQPLIRSLREEFALSLGFSAQDGKTLLNNSGTKFGDGADANGNTRTRVLKFGQDYLSRDLAGAWAVRSQFNVGLNALNATTNPDPAPSGQFFSWLGQVQRAQTLSADHLLIAQADLQLTPNSLFPSQQFTIGGGQILRGYSQSARSGDNGFRVSIEDRIALQKDSTGAPTLQLAPFIDFGSVWNKSNNPSQLPTSQNFLSSVGLGAIYAPCPQCTLRIDYALPLINLNQQGETAQNRSISFSAGYSF